MIIVILHFFIVFFNSLYPSSMKELIVLFIQLLFTVIVWDLFKQENDKFKLFLRKVIDLLLNQEISVDQFDVYIQFLKYLFRVCFWFVFHLVY